MESDGTRRSTGGEVKGKEANGVGIQHSCTVSDTVYPALLPLMRTPRLPAADWTDTRADINGLVRFAGRPNMVSARVPSHSVFTLPDCIALGHTFLFPAQWTTEKSFFDYGRGKIFTLLHNVHCGSGPEEPLFSWYQCTFVPGPWPLPPNVEVQNMWSYTSAPHMSSWLAYKQLDLTTILWGVFSKLSLRIIITFCFVGSFNVIIY